jgi:SAM (Sterile alpha motif) domain-containing protein/adenylate/guanylate cyclase family protein
MDIVVWLRSLGLGKYEAAFRENEIDETVLPSLTEEHLKQLGVTALGHRVKLLDAIAALRNDASGRAPPIDAATALSTPRAHPEDRAERRQVTVMFSDLVGSTALSARMDPEDLREVISAYQKCVAETVQRFGGFVAKYMGDGVLVYFGYPQAHEDDAERAVRAGLELVAAVPPGERKGADTWVFGADPGNLRRAATDWWSNEDSNQGPGQFYRWRAIGSVRDRGRSRTPPRCDSVCGSCNGRVNPPWVRRFQAVGTVRAKTPEDRKDGKSRRRGVAVHRVRP